MTNNDIFEEADNEVGIDLHASQTVQRKEKPMWKMQTIQRKPELDKLVSTLPKIEVVSPLDVFGTIPMYFTKPVIC